MQEFVTCSNGIVTSNVIVRPNVLSNCCLAKHFYIGHCHLQFKCPYSNVLCGKGYGHANLTFAALQMYADGTMYTVQNYTIWVGLMEAPNTYTIKYLTKS